MLTAIYVREEAELIIHATAGADKAPATSARLYRYHRLGSMSAVGSRSLERGIYGIQSAGSIDVQSPSARIETIPYRKGDELPAPSPDAKVIVITFGDKDGWPDLTLDLASIEGGATSDSVRAYFVPLTVQKDI